MTIADKLVYLDETKTALREALNAAGANITTDTTFRDYAAWVDYVAWLQSGGPLNLFANGEQGVWYDPSDLTTLFQDADGTTPVTADGDPVGLMLDKSGNGNHAIQEASAARPVYRTDGVLHWLAFDGVDDGLSSATFQHTGAWCAVASVNNRSSNGSVFDSGSQAQQLRTISGNFGTVRYSNTGSPLVINTNVSVVEAIHVLTTIATTDTTRLRIDGNETLTRGYSGASASIEEPLVLGRRSSSISQIADMDLYGGIYVCSDTQQIEMVERHLAKLAGVQL